jgi:hypothetical protein
MSLRTLILCMILASVSVVSLDSFNLKNFLKDTLKKTGTAVAIAGVIRKFSTQLDNFINGVTLNKGVPNKQSTKVVPLFSFGDRTALGGAQVSGSQERVARVRAVFRIEDQFQRGRFRVSAFVPTTSSTKLERVQEVGVTALVDYHVR